MKVANIVTILLSMAAPYAVASTCSEVRFGANADYCVAEFKECVRGAIPDGCTCCGCGNADFNCGICDAGCNEFATDDEVSDYIEDTLCTPGSGSSGSGSSGSGSRYQCVNETESKVVFNVRFEDDNSCDCVTMDDDCWTEVGGCQKDDTCGSSGNVSAAPTTTPTAAPTAAPTTAPTPAPGMVTQAKYDADIAAAKTSCLDEKRRLRALVDTTTTADSAPPTVLTTDNTTTTADSAAAGLFPGIFAVAAIAFALL